MSDYDARLSVMTQFFPSFRQLGGVLFVRKYPMYAPRKILTICFSLQMFLPTLGNCASPQELVFDRREFSIFVASFPRWETKEFVDIGPSGKLMLHDPKGDGRFVRVSWNKGEPLTIEEEKAFISNAGGVIVETFTLTEDASSIVGYRERYEKSKEVAVSSVYCKETNSAIRVTSFLNLEWQELLAIHRKITQSISCLKPTRENPARFKYPIFKAGKNYQEINGNIAYSQPDEGLFIFSSAMPYIRFEETPNLPGAMELMVRKLLGDQIQFDKITSYSKDSRQYIAAPAVFEKQRSHMVAMWWKCPDNQTGFFGVYLGPYSANLDKAKSTLATATCPYDDTSKEIHAVIGVSANALSAEIVKAFNLPTDKGALVTKVKAGSPAQLAGLTIGDIILQVDGKDVDSVESLFQSIDSKPPGSSLELKILRSKWPLTVYVVSEKFEVKKSVLPSLH